MDVFLLLLVLATGDAYALDGPYTVADCVMALVTAPVPPDGASLVCAPVAPIQVVA